jgi:hypothetical protein
MESGCKIIFRKCARSFQLPVNGERIAIVFNFRPGAEMDDFNRRGFLYCRVDFHNQDISFIIHGVKLSP